MITDAEKILKRLQERKHDKQKVTLYLSKRTFEAFQDKCRSLKYSASEVIEELMREFTESVKKR